MKNGLVRRLGSATLVAVLGLSASAAQAQGVQDSPPPPASTTAAPYDSPGRISFYDGRPLLGGKPMEGDAFYRLVGRPDLAQQYRRRQERKSIATGASITVAGAGLLWGLGNIWWHEFRCCGTPQKPVSPYPWLLVGAGLTGVVVLAEIPTDPIAFDQRVDLARAHNARVRLLPALHPDGGGLAVVGSF